MSSSYKPQNEHPGHCDICGEETLNECLDLCSKHTKTTWKYLKWKVRNEYFSKEEWEKLPVITRNKLLESD